MRRPHFLRSPTRQERAQSAVFYDTETDQIPAEDGGVRHVLRFGWACHTRRLTSGAWSAPTWMRFTSREQFWRALEGWARPKTRTYMFAHNAGFDLSVLGAFTELPARGWVMGRAVIECPPVIIEWRRGTSTLVALDTLNWWRTSLAELGRSVGLDKLAMPDQHAPQDVWDTYARRDVEVIHHAMLSWWDFIERERFGGFAPTLASQALRGFKSRFLHHEVAIDCDERALALARESLHGGRVEAYRLGRIPHRVSVLDINSMYPYVMAERVYPARLLGRYTRVRLDELREWITRRCLVAAVRLDTDEPVYASVQGDRLTFPVGRFRTVLTTPELAYALEQDHVVSCDEACAYVAEPLFTDFVTTIYQLRLAAAASGDRLTAYLYKIMMNSLYGKFGQRGMRWETIGRSTQDGIRSWTEIDADTGTIRKLREFGGARQEYHREGESEESHPAIAAHVTAYARMYLWELMMLAGRESVVYCDTDSLFVADEGRARLAHLISSSTLGGLKDEGSVVDLVIHGAKDYESTTKTAVKGVRKSAVWTSEHSVVQDQWSTLVGLVAAGDLDAPTTRQVEKTMARVYLKGLPQPDGTVLPFRRADP